MKTTFTSKQAIVEKCLRNVWQPLPLIVFTLFFSTIPTSHGGYLRTGDSNSPTSRDKSEVEYDHIPPLSFQALQEVAVQPIIEWDKTIGGNSGDLLFSAISTPDGGYLLAGYSQSDASGDKSEDSQGERDYWIVKTDTDGNKVWDKTLGGNSSDELYSIITTVDGGYLLAGTSLSDASGDKSEDSKGQNDYWIVKIDAQGNKVWDKTLGGSGPDYLYSAISTPDGSYLLAGYSESDASGDKSEDSQGEKDYWVVKIDAQGNKVWDKTLGGSGSDGLYRAISSPDGGYLLAGYSESEASGDKSGNSKGFEDYWIVKIDAQGNKVWDKTLGGSGPDQLRTAISTSDGGYLLAGSSYSHDSGDKSEPSRGQSDYWIVKIDADGNKEWDKTFGGGIYDEILGNSITSTHDGGYLLAGTSDSPASKDKSEDSNDPDYWLVKIDAYGNKIWDKTIGGSEEDQPYSVISTSDGGYLLTGYSSSNASGDKSENNKGGRDYWIVKLQDQNIPVVISLTIINAQTDQEIRELKDGDYVSLEEVGRGLLSIRAHTFPEMIDRVRFELSGPITHTQVEKTPPYALFGDNQGNYSGKKLFLGKYTLTVTPFTKDKKGIALTVSFEVVKDGVTVQPTIEWDKTLGGSGGEELYSTILTPDGGYLLAGSSGSNASGDKSENSIGNYDYWVVKIDEYGNKLWDKTLGGNDVDELFSIVSTPDGGYLLAGTSDSDASGDKSENSKGNLDYWIVKIDADGNKVWDKTLGGSGGEELYSTILTPDGGYLLAGYSFSDASGDKSENSRGQDSFEFDYWVVKIDALGNKVWDKTLGGNHHDLLQSVISTPDGGYLLVGSSGSDASGDKSEDGKGNGDAWVVKIDDNGSKVWDKTIGGSNRDGLSSIIPTPDGGYLLGGFSRSDISGDKSENNKGWEDYWIVKTDALGSKVWDKTIGGSSRDELSRIIPTPDGGYLLAGYSFSDASGDKSEDSKGGVGGDCADIGHCYPDYWAVKIDAQGNKVWDKTIGGSNYDYLYSAIPTPDGGYLLAGYSDSDASGDKSENSKGEFDNDYWIVKLQDHTTPIVTSLTLIDAQTDQEIQELKNGDIINLAEIGSGLLNIRANISASQIQHVRLQLQGPVRHTQVEKQFPYALFGDNQGDYAGRQLPAGRYTLTATPSFRNIKGIALTVSFEVTEDPEAIARQVKVYPVPTLGVINILYEGVAEEAHLMLLDFRGKMLLHQPLSTQPVEQIDLSGFKKGIYYLRIVSAEGVQVFRIAKE